MKRILLPFAFIIAGLASSAQISADIEAYSAKHANLDFESDLIEVSMPSLDMSVIEAEDTDGKNAEVYMISRHHHVNLNLSNSGTWTDVAGGKLWRLKVRSRDAKGLILYYNDFFMPNGATMHVFNEDKSHVLGAFTSVNNKEGNVFATDITRGESCTIEYFEPDAVIGLGRISIDKVSHVYRGMKERSTEERSDPCEVDVRCPEGDDWGPQIDGVVKIIVVSNQGSGFCSGSVINNSAQDCAPYILTAMHCGVNLSASLYNQWVFQFNRQKACGGSGLIEGTQAITGGTRRAHSNDGGGNSGSDYMLMELSSQIPNSYGAYYNGWNKSTAASPSGVSIHHPAGDIKKISTYSNSLVSTNWGSAAGSHWRVRWVATVTNHGVTEGGSSGSPIFDNNGYIVGQLTGGSSYCVSPNQPDLYGKMSYNWTSNPGDDLKNWLDPTNSGVTTLEGRYWPCPNGIEDKVLEDRTNIYPNPSTGLFTLEMKDNIGLVNVNVYNSLGALVASYQMSNGLSIQLDLSRFENGLYYVNLTSENAQTTKRISLVK